MDKETEMIAQKLFMAFNRCETTEDFKALVKFLQDKGCEIDEKFVEAYAYLRGCKKISNGKNSLGYYFNDVFKAILLATGQKDLFNLEMNQK